MALPLEHLGHLGLARGDERFVVVGSPTFTRVQQFSLGVYSALRPRSLLDRTAMVFVLIGISAHPVWIGLILAILIEFSARKRRRSVHELERAAARGRLAFLNYRALVFLGTISYTQSSVSVSIRPCRLRASSAFELSFRIRAMRSPISPVRA